MDIGSHKIMGGSSSIGWQNPWIWFTKPKIWSKAIISIHPTPFPTTRTACSLLFAPLISILGSSTTTPNPTPNPSRTLSLSSQGSRRTIDSMITSSSFILHLHYFHIHLHYFHNACCRSGAAPLFSHDESPPSIDPSEDPIIPYLPTHQ